jgi:hypothetical protein
MARSMTPLDQEGQAGGYLGHGGDKEELNDEEPKGGWRGVRLFSPFTQIQALSFLPPFRILFLLNHPFALLAAQCLFHNTACP